MVSPQGKFLTLYFNPFKKNDLLVRNNPKIFKRRKYVEELKDKTITCLDCGNEFVFTVNDQQFYKEKGFINEPKRCKACREKRKQERANRENQFKEEN